MDIKLVTFRYGWYLLSGQGEFDMERLKKSLVIQERRSLFCGS